MSTQIKTNSSSFKLSSVGARVKAFIIDIFMVYVPIIYFFTYIIAGGVQNFHGNGIYPFLCFAIFTIIQSLFLSIKGQTLGYKYSSLYIFDIKNKQKPTFILSLIRFVIFYVSYSLLFGMVFVFLRKDRINLHDLLTNTRILHKQEKKWKEKEYITLWAMKI